ncbi:MAG TPA: hypothetical protein VFI11_06605 [Anaerolineales bacterium]|nr:hypothetical protein [Anaerolineales bacterium]
MKRVNLAEKFDLIRVHWWPKIAGKLNGQYEAEVHGLWLQPISSLNTGNVTNDRTRQQPDWI